jgi:hypothetical protein
MRHEQRPFQRGVVGICFERIDRDLLLLVLGERPPTKDEWAGWLTFVGAGSYNEPRVLVHSAGGGPDAAQRRGLAQILARYPRTSVAVLVDSFLGRGIVTALGWTYGNFASFRTAELRAALQHLGRPQAEMHVASRVVALRASLVGGVGCRTSEPPIRESLAP